MLILVHRRHVLLGLTALSASPLFASADPFTALERRHGGRLGVFAFDTGTGRQLAHRADERFLMCSMFKLPLAAAVLARVDAGQMHLADRIRYSAKDVIGHAPVTKAHLGQGFLSVEELCAAAVTMSDNGAANLLLAAVGGPQALTRFARTQGDSVTRFDRTELSCNDPAGDLDTTTPRAFVGLLRTVLLGDALKPESRKRLGDWMIVCETGKDRLRATFPRDWRAGDKTGTGDTEINDAAIAWPPSRKPVFVCALYNAPRPTVETGEAVLREAGELAVQWLA